MSTESYSAARFTSESPQGSEPTQPILQPHLPLPLILGEVHLFEDLGTLLHHQCLLIGVGRDVTLMLWGEQKKFGAGLALVPAPSMAQHVPVVLCPSMVLCAPRQALSGSHAQHP